MQTFALLVMAEQGDLQIDEVVFADTGGEHPETYEHINKVAKPICDRMGIPFTCVKMNKTVDDISELRDDALAQYLSTMKISQDMEWKTRQSIRGELKRNLNIPKKTVTSLRDEIIARRRVPSINPSSRWCTSDAKILPIQYYIREQQNKQEYIKPCVAVIGIGYEEMSRMYRPHLSEYTVEYPLIDRKMVREACIEYVHKHGYESPPKSGCYYCPFQTISQWKILREAHNELFKDAMSLEESDVNYPKYGLLPKRGWTLRKLDGFLSDSVQSTLFDDDLRGVMFCEQGAYCGV